ncbi:hypothetical protein AURDEDRAFT_122121 [Auricularia subglabra TFB-10046 SS5]|nr:hypothetical protein AURDEDRAFT_122121 [Auricularia subglabra TFB-10046 SS5]
MSNQQLVVPDVDQVAHPAADEPPPYAPDARARRAGFEQIALNVLMHVLEVSPMLSLVQDPYSSLMTRSHVKAVLIPARGGPVMPIMVAVDYDMVTRPPIPRVIQEHLAPFITGPTLYVDLQVLCGNHELHIRVFRHDRASLPVNRSIHQERYPQAAWRGDIVVMGRGHLFFYEHISPRMGPYIMRALELAGECSVRAGVRLAV